MGEDRVEKSGMTTFRLLRTLAQMVLSLCHLERRRTQEKIWSKNKGLRWQWKPNFLTNGIISPDRGHWARQPELLLFTSFRERRPPPGHRAGGLVRCLCLWGGNGKPADLPAQDFMSCISSEWLASSWGDICEVWKHGDMLNEHQELFAICEAPVYPSPRRPTTSYVVLSTTKGMVVPPLPENVYFSGKQIVFDKCSKMLCWGGNIPFIPVSYGK